MVFHLKTERLILREWRDEDRDPMFLYLSQNQQVMEYLGGIQNREDSEAGIDRCISCQAKNGHCFWALERKNDGVFLGFCGIKRIDDETFPDFGSAEIGWQLRPEVWGQGYAKEAAVATLDFAFDQLDEPMVTGFTTPANKASSGLMERLGMERRADLDYFDSKWGAIIGIESVYRIDELQWARHRKSLI